MPYILKNSPCSVIGQLFEGNNVSEYSIFGGFGIGVLRGLAKELAINVGASIFRMSKTQKIERQ